MSKSTTFLHKHYGILEIKLSKRADNTILWLMNDKILPYKTKNNNFLSKMCMCTFLCKYLKHLQLTNVKELDPFL